MSSIEFFVSPDGSDSNSGTKAEPFASLAHARDAVRAVTGSRPVTVYLREGTYRIRETVVFGLQDSGGPETPVKYCAFPGEEPVLTSQQKIDGWRKAENFPEGLSSAARENLWVADIPEDWQGEWPFRTLFDGDEMLPRARTEGFLPGRTTEGRENRWKNLDYLVFPEGALSEWENLEDVEIRIRPSHVWIVNYLTLKSVDLEKGVARTTVPGTYTLNGLPRKHADISCWVENVPEGLTNPGQWMLNSREKKLYLWPRNGKPGDDISAPVLHELIRVEGRNVEELEGDEPVRNIEFGGMTFTGGERDILTNEDKGIQHDWEMFDKGNALLRFRGAEDCAVENCTFRNSAGSALRVDLYGKRVTVTRNHIHNIGGTGILLCGYGPGFKDVNDSHEVVNNEIHHCGMVLSHSMAVFIWQSGKNRVLNNYIHHLPYDAIVLSGVRPRYFGISDPVKWTTSENVIPDDLRENMRVIRWRETGHPENEYEALKFAHAKDNLVQDNELHNVMELLGDGNAIYYSCAGTGNVVHRNLIYRTWRAATEIRFDDDQEESTVSQNIIIGNGIKLKHRNYIENNIIIGGGIHVRPETAPGSRVQRNVVFRKGEFDSLYTSRDEFLKLTDADCNVFYAEDEEKCRELLEHIQNLGSDAGSVCEDPFVGLAKGDFRIREDSHAAEMGITQIETEQIGLLHDPAFPRLRKIGFDFLTDTGEAAEVYE